jgi:hypothetical protein
MVYIEDLLLNTDMHEKHLEVLDKVRPLAQESLEDKPGKMCFRKQGFMLTPEGINPCKNKLKAIKDAKPATDIKIIRSCVGLCNIFRTHINDFVLIAALIFWLTRKDSGYKSGQLPDQALQAFYALQKQLTSKPVMTFPKPSLAHTRNTRSSQKWPQA